jgi:hypothetical protein
VTRKKGTKRWLEAEENVCVCVYAEQQIGRIYFRLDYYFDTFITG